MTGYKEAATKCSVSVSKKGLWLTRRDRMQRETAENLVLSPFAVHSTVKIFRDSGAISACKGCCLSVCDLRGLRQHCTRNCSYAFWFCLYNFCVSLVQILGFWEVPSTASLHSGVHLSSQRAQWWDGGRQEVRPQVRNCQACADESSKPDLAWCWSFSAYCMVSNLYLCLLQHARANRAVPSPTCPAKPGGGVSRCYLFLLRGVHQQVSISLSLSYTYTHLNLSGFFHLSLSLSTYFPAHVQTSCLSDHCSLSSWGLKVSSTES